MFNKRHQTKRKPNQEAQNDFPALGAYVIWKTGKSLIFFYICFQGLEKPRKLILFCKKCGKNLKKNLSKMRNLSFLMINQSLCSWHVILFQ